MTVIVLTGLWWSSAGVQNWTVVSESLDIKCEH